MITKNTERATPSIHDREEDDTRVAMRELSTMDRCGYADNPDALMPSDEPNICDYNPDALMPSDELTFCDDEPAIKIKKNTKKVKTVKKVRKAKKKKKKPRQPKPDSTEEQSPDANATDEKFDPAQLTSLVARAKERDKEAIHKLKDIYDNHPEIWQAAGNLARISEHALIERIAGADCALVGAIRRYVDSMKGELAGSAPTPLEKLLVERVVQCHLQLQYVDMLVTANPNLPLPQAKYWAIRQDQADKRFHRAVKSLSMMRALLPREYLASAPVAAVSGPAEQQKPMNGSRAAGQNGNGSGAEGEVAIDLPPALRDRMNGHSSKKLVPVP